MISFEPLWRTLESKKISKMELREMIGISKAMFAKLGKNESVTPVSGYNNVLPLVSLKFFQGAIN